MTDGTGAPQRAFECSVRTRIVFGAGVAGSTGALAAECGGRRALLVTDAGVVGAGHAARVADALVAAGLEVRQFDAVRENPSTVDAEACAEAMRAAPVDIVVAVGGGSAIDAAKAGALLAAGGGTVEDYWGVGKARGTVAPLIAVPTTAGTGSEVQSFALISQPDTHQKMACGDPQLAPRVAVLDPRLTCSMPASVTACTGMDAIGHAVETAVTARRNPASALFARGAFELLNEGLPRALTDPDDLDARGAMLLGATWAGLAIEHSMLGAAHALANPLTAHHGLTHGQAVGTVLPAVVRHNAREPQVAALYAALAARGGLPASAAALADRLDALIALVGWPASLRAHGVVPSTALAAEAARQWTAQFNPIPVAQEDLLAMLRASCG